VFLIPLLLGALATILPPLALTALMAHNGHAARLHPQLPLKTISWFFLIPLVSLLFFGSDALSQVHLTDAVLGTGAIALIYLLALKAGARSNTAFTWATLGIIVYGLLRAYAWGSHLEPLHTEALNSAFEQMRQIQQNIDESVIQATLAAVNKLWPAQWMITQILALFVGFILFKSFSRIDEPLSSRAFPAFYNLFILAVLPLYFIPSLRLYFFNALPPLCMIPFIQGVAVANHKIASIFRSKVVRVVIMILLLLNYITYILLTLIGFAYMWKSPLILQQGDTPQ
jgi:hypothetical protein